MEQDSQQVYYLPRPGQKLVRVTSDLVQPNGIIGTPDGKILYVADLGAGKTYRYRIQADGSLTDRSLFCDMGSDGMTIDANGNVYLTGKGVTIFNANGDKIGHIEIPQGWTTNVCFGGPDRTTLFITAGDSLYSIRTTTHGPNPPSK
jgi:gluconolactonase